MNKNGWGLRAELGFLLLFLVCILIATIGLHSLGLTKDKEGAYVDLSEYTRSGTFDYNALEVKVANAGKQYYIDKYPNGTSETVIVNISALKNGGYMTGIYDSRNKECNGYAKILNNGNSFGYIDCTVYSTMGYDKNVE